MSKFRCAVAIPTRELFLGEIEAAKIPGAEGYLGILSGHENFVGLNAGGMVTLTIDDKETKQFLIKDGITQMMNNHLAILPRFGRKPEDIDRAHAEETIKYLEGELEKVRASDKEDVESEEESLSARLSWYQTQMKFLDGELL